MPAYIAELYIVADKQFIKIVYAFFNEAILAKIHKHVKRYIMDAKETLSGCA